MLRSSVCGLGSPCFTRQKSLLWAGFEEDIKVDDGGRYVIPFGRWHPGLSENLLEAMKDGGTGENGKFAE
ncbi:hypothetical protein ASPFODRAFT_50425 [Aspergillus luchuensis CBS 106.47]|uniref:Uncharacterized protein n=1 Tax=Aspergillus luchuensis (strain CBS 106.47) TaxID=1137211 RepID=A0A1M3T765_ASPLC|nr:hypothetical protein ASPFODRAFT_50425 [Aspergillus luchuensis CBS 106.47]